MDYEERDERLFLIRMFKFIFQIVSVALPSDLQKEYDRFPYDEQGFFTESITKAVLILMNERYDDVDEIPNIDSEDFRRIAHELASYYEPEDFLKFCSWFGMKAALGHCGENFYAYRSVWSAIENIFQETRAKGGFDIETWDTLDNVASKIVQEDDINHRRLPDFNPYAELNLEEEKAFVLRIMQHVFGYHSVEFPMYYWGHIRRLDEQNYHLSENVKKAIDCLIDILLVPEKRLGVIGLTDYYFSFCFEPFKEREYLEYCISFSKYAMVHYYRYNETANTFFVFDSCVKKLQDVRKKGLPTPWRKIEETAIDILEENEHRLEDKRLREQRLHELMNRSKKEFDDLEQSKLSTEDKFKFGTEKQESGESYNQRDKNKLEFIEMDELRRIKQYDETAKHGKSIKTKDGEMGKTKELDELKSNEVHKPDSGEVKESELIDKDKFESVEGNKQPEVENENGVINLFSNNIVESESVKANEQEKSENISNHNNCNCCKCS